MKNSASPFLRPLGNLELIDLSLRIYRLNFFRFLGIFGIAQVAGILISGLFSWLAQENLFRMDYGGILTGNYTEIQWESMFYRGINAMANLLLVNVLAVGVISRAATDIYLGRPVHILEAYRRNYNFWTLLGALAIGALILVVLLAIINIPCIGWMMIGVYIFHSIIVMPILIPTAVIEKQTVFQTFARAWELPMRRFWPVLKLMGLMVLIGLFISVPSSLVAILAEAAPITIKQVIGGPEITTNAALIVVEKLRDLLYIPLQTIVATLLYFDLRTRTEGFDLALAAKSTAEDMAPADVAAQIPPLKNGAANPVGNLVLLSILIIGSIIGLFILLFAIGRTFSIFS